MLKIKKMEEIIKYFPNITEIQKQQFQKLEALYHDWNSKINVISRKDIDELYTKHVLHSLAIAKIQNSNPELMFWMWVPEVDSPEFHWQFFSPKRVFI